MATDPMEELIEAAMKALEPFSRAKLRSSGYDPMDQGGTWEIRSANELLWDHFRQAAEVYSALSRAVQGKGEGEP